MPLIQLRQWQVGETDAQGYDCDSSLALHDDTAQECLDGPWMGEASISLALLQLPQHLGQGHRGPLESLPVLLGDQIVEV